MHVSKKLGQLQEVMMNVDQDNFLRDIVQESIQKALDCEFANFIGAKQYERTADRRGYRNGSYDRMLKTRVGTLQLHICRDRDGEFQTELFNRYQRSEKALVLGMIEMYFSGVATRKVGGILEELCGFSVSKSQVSELVCDLDKKLNEWRERPLGEEYTYLIFDARYEKVRENGHVVSKAFVTTIGITRTGYREIIGCSIINSESYEAWDSLLTILKNRGLQGTEYIVSDDNRGLRNALAKHFQGIKLQRCQVHYMRNFLDKLSKNERADGIRLLRDIFAAETKQEAKRRTEIAQELLVSKKKEKVAQWLEETIEESLIVLELPIEHRKKMKSTNMLERFNQELKKRSRLVRIFPNADSCLRLLSALCQETSEGWANRLYLNMNI
jgi:transposase-like protein